LERQEVGRRSLWTLMNLLSLLRQEKDLQNLQKEML